MSMQPIESLTFSLHTPTTVSIPLRFSLHDQPGVTPAHPSSTKLHDTFIWHIMYASLIFFVINL